MNLSYKKNPYAHLAISLAFLMFVVFGCDGVSRIGARVVDKDGRPLKDAIILFEDATKGKSTGSYECKTQSRSDGYFECQLIHAPVDLKLRLTIAKDGYKTYIQETSSGELAKSSKDNIGPRVIVLEQLK